jgi:site-specific recombinase XerD
MADPSRVRVTGPLVPYVDGFSSELAELGYSLESMANHVRLMAYLSRWLASQDLDGHELTPQRVSQFLAARRDDGYARLVSERGFSPLLDHLRRLWVVPPVPQVESTPLQALLDDYRGYLVRERGVIAKTVRRYEVVAHLFLSETLSTTAALDLDDLTAGGVMEFVLRECRRRSVGSAKDLVCALRSLLRYLHVAGLTPRQLAPGVPTVAGWRGSSLPRALGPEEVVKLLVSCDRGTAVGRRDYAILTLLVRLGLRAGEVAALELQDVDWRRGEIVIRGKGRRQERLPLPVDVGEAVVDYLCRGGRHEGCAQVFMRARAPHHRLGSTAVQAVVRHAAERASLPSMGAHRLRHTAATEMLRAGAPLPEIGQVLRHRSLRTTAIYAKVDRTNLRTLALPWPRGAA